LLGWLGAVLEDDGGSDGENDGEDDDEHPANITKISKIAEAMVINRISFFIHIPPQCYLLQVLQGNFD